MRLRRAAPLRDGAAASEQVADMVACRSGALTRDGPGRARGRRPGATHPRVVASDSTLRCRQLQGASSISSHPDFDGPSTRSERVIAYIDGFNLYHGLMEAHMGSSRWLDLAGMSQSLLEPHQRLVLVRYFTTRIRNQPRQGGTSEHLHRRRSVPRRLGDRLRVLSQQEGRVPTMREQLARLRVKEDRCQHSRAPSRRRLGRPL